MCLKELLAAIFSKKEKPMIRAQGSDQSPYSHLKITGSGKLDFGITAVTDGTYTHPAEKVDPLIPDCELLGLYHYLRSAKPIGTQIDVFDKAIKPYAWDFLMVDFEKKNNTHLGGGFAKMAKKFIDEFIEAYGKPVLLYTGPSVVQEWMLPFGETWYQNYELMIAQYPYNEVNGPQEVLKEVPTLTDKWNPRLPAGSTNWKIWQYSANGNGRANEFGATGNPDLDLDVFNGTIEEMKIWAKKESSPPVVIPPVVDCEEQVALCNAECEKRIAGLLRVHELEVIAASKKANNQALQNLINPHIIP